MAAPSAAERAERDAVYAILRKRNQGAKLSSREVARVARYERSRRERLIDEAFESGVTQKRLCELFGVSRKVLLEWEAKGAPRNPDKRYPLRPFLVWWKEHTLAQAKEPSDKESPALEEKRKWDAKRSKLAYQREKAQLVQRTDAEAERLALAHVFVNALGRLSKDFASAFPNQDLAEHAAWLETWQEAERRRILDQAAGAKGASA